MPFSNKTFLCEFGVTEDMSIVCHTSRYEGN